MTAGKRRLMSELEEELERIQRSEPPQIIEEMRIKQEIEELRNKIDSVPFIDTFDLRFKTTKSARFPPVRR